MKEMNKRVASWLLIAIMVISGLPSRTVFAASAAEVTKNRIYADSGNETITIAYKDTSFKTEELHVWDGDGQVNTFGVKRDYNQSANVRVDNITGQNVRFYLAVENKYEDLYLNFTKDGSIDEPLTLRSGGSISVELSIFAQNARRASYDIPVNSYIIENGNERLAGTGTIKINVEQPPLDVRITAGARDQYTLEQKFTIRNNSSQKITDLSLELLGDVESYAKISPLVNNLELGGYQSITVGVIPNLAKFKKDDITAVTGQLNAFSGASGSAANISFDTQGQPITATTMGRLALLQDDNPFWDLKRDSTRSANVATNMDNRGYFNFVSTNYFVYSEGSEPIELTTTITTSSRSSAVEARSAEGIISSAQYRQLLEENIPAEKLMGIIPPPTDVFVSVGFETSEDLTDEEFRDLYRALATLNTHKTGINVVATNNAWHNPTTDLEEKLTLMYSTLGKVMLGVNHTPDEFNFSLLDAVCGEYSLSDHIAPKNNN